MPVAVVGAGLSGLAAAVELGRRRPVTLIERLPAVGGTWGFDHPLVIELAAECRAVGVEMLLGVSALRWDRHRLLVVGPGHVRWLETSGLAYAGGTRPATAAELHIAGGRLAGVFAVTVAHHLLDAGVVLGRRAVVVGEANSAGSVLDHLTHHGHVDLVDPGGHADPSDPERLPTGELSQSGLKWWQGWRAVKMTGSARVNSVLITNGQAELALDCDCVILAGGERALRNVDGAISDASPGVVFVAPQSTNLSAMAAVAAGRQAGREAASLGPTLTSIHLAMANLQGEP